MDKILSAEQSTISSQDLCKFGYIYLTTNLVNNKKYIGMHKSSTFSESYKGSGKILWRAIRKYGWENFKVEVVKWCYSQEDLVRSEIDEIESRDAVSSDEYYNVMPGGHGGDNKTMLSPEEHQEFTQKISSALKGHPKTENMLSCYKRRSEAMKGHPVSEETRQKSRDSNVGQVRSDGARRNMSKNHADVSGSKNPMYGVHLKHSEDHNRKISESFKGRIWMTDKVSKEVLIRPEEYDDYASQGYVRGRLRKSQRDKIKNLQR